MTTASTLRGFAGQSMVARKTNKAAQEPYSFPVGGSTYSFVPPRAGYWKFVAWGPGGAGAAGVTAGASGAYGEITRFLTPATPVTIAVATNADTVITFADGKVATAGKAALAVAGVASGFDYMLNGTAGVATGNIAGNPGQGTGGGGGGTPGGGSGGAGAPARLPYRGGTGSGGSTSNVAGNGAGDRDGGTTSTGQGLVLAVFIKS